MKGWRERIPHAAECEKAYFSRGPRWSLFVRE